MKINNENYEQFFVDFVENNLSVAERAEVMEFVKQNPKLKAELDLFAMTIAEPDETIVYENKEELKHHENDRKVIFLFNWKFVSAAAAAVLFMFWFLQKPAGLVEPAKQASAPAIVKDSAMQMPEQEVQQPKEPMAQTVSPAPKNDSPAPAMQHNPMAVQHNKQPVLQKPNAEMPLEPNKINDEQLAVQGRDTSSIKPEIKDKVQQTLEKPLMAEEKNKPAPVAPDTVLMAKNNTQPVEADEQPSLKEKVTGQIASRLGGWLGYLSKPDFSVKTVKVNDKTRIVFNIENDRVHLMGSMRAGL